MRAPCSRSALASRPSSVTSTSAPIARGADVEVDRAPADAVAADRGARTPRPSGGAAGRAQDRDAVQAGELDRHVGAGLVDRIDRDALAVDVDADAERRRMSAVMSTSPMSGRWGWCWACVPSTAATMCLVTAFFDPLTSTSPRSGPLGRMCQASAVGGVHQCEATGPTRPFGRADGPRSVVEGGCRSAVPSLTCALTRTRGDRV